MEESGIEIKKIGFTIGMRSKERVGRISKRRAKQREDIVSNLHMVTSQIRAEPDDDISWLTAKTVMHDRYHFRRNFPCCAAPASVGQGDHALDGVIVGYDRAICHKYGKRCVDQVRYQTIRALEGRCTIQCATPA